MAKYVKQSVAETLSYLAYHGHVVSSSWAPNTDVYETPDNLVVRMETAGLDREGLEIALSDRLLVVRGFRRDPCRQRRCSFHQMEIDYGFFERRIVVPRKVDGHRARARFENGFLHIELPKSDTAALVAVTLVVEEWS